MYAIRSYYAMPIESFRDLMRLIHGFEAAKIVLVANDLDLFSRLGSGRGAAELAAELGVDGRALGLLMNALVALGLLEKENGRFRNAPPAETFLVRGEKWRGSILRHLHHCWEAWNVITSYSIHYTKLYEMPLSCGPRHAGCRQRPRQQPR